MKCRAMIQSKKQSKQQRCKRTASKDGDGYCTPHFKKYLKTPKKVEEVEEVEKVEEDEFEIIPHVRHLMEVNSKMPEQRTQAWLERRWEMLTASDAAAALLVSDHELKLMEEGIVEIKSTFQKLGKGCYCYKSIKQLYREKAKSLSEKSKYFSNKFTWHGTKYEPVATELYEHKNNCKVIDFGVMPHPKHLFLGASPDGITTNGRMLEIKVPYSRQLSGIPPLHYWIQMQMQMECCDLDVCDFVECKIGEYSSEEAYIADTFTDEDNNQIYGLTENGMNKGCVLVITHHDGDETKRDVKYSPMASQMKNGHADMLKWIKDTLFELASGNNGDNLIQLILQEGLLSVERCWWKIDEYSQLEVKRDTEWFRKRLPDFEEFWNNVKIFRANGLPETLKTKKQKESEAEDSEDVETVSILSTTTTTTHKSKKAKSSKVKDNGFLIVLDEDNS